MARNMRPENIADLVNVGEPGVAPDGKTVAFTVTSVDLDENCYRSQVWLAATDASSPPRPFSAGRDKDTRPRWSPNGSELAFVSHRRGDDEGCELYVAPVAGGGEIRRIAEWPEEIEELAWSPDGSRLAFLARLRDECRYGTPGPRKDGNAGKVEVKDQPPRRITRLFSRLDSVGWVVDRVRQLFVVPSDGSAKPRAVTSGPFQVDGLSWSPDGTQLAFSSGRHDTWDLDLATDLFTVVVPDDGSEAGNPRQLTATGHAYGSPSWSPDGTELAVNYFGDPSSEPRHGQIGVLDLALGVTDVLTTGLDRQCVPYPSAREPVWDSNRLVFAVEDQGNTHLYRTGPIEQLVGGDREVSAFDLVAGMLAFCASTPTATTELFVVDTNAKRPEERRLTHLGERFGRAHDLAGPVPFTATAPDGFRVPAWIMAPAGATTARAGATTARADATTTGADATTTGAGAPTTDTGAPDSGAPGTLFPALLNIHGGPFTQYGNRFFDEFQLQVGAGFVVVYCNPRGSSGGTEASGRAIRWPEAEEDPGSGWGGVDYDDVMAVIDAAIERFPWIDPERLGVLGGSYGGYMTSWIVGHDDRFQAAVSERSCNNLLALEQSSDVATGFRAIIGVSHLDNPEAYLRQSPITYVRAMTTPMLLIHSENDLRCPISQAEELFVALRLLGRNPEFVRFPGESHELSRSGSPKHRIMRAEIILAWFRRHLMTR
jgi:dipeptidyl aminopeptidase/acylaminoacyl peptidase